MSTIESSEIQPLTDAPRRRGIPSYKGWKIAGPDQFVDRAGCVTFVDMVGSTALWETIWELTGKAPVEDANALKRACWAIISGAQNEVLRAFVNERSQAGSFVKGIGDGFIFYGPSVVQAYYNARDAENQLGKYLRKAILEKPIILKNEYKLLVSGLKKITFRFLIHWMSDKVIHGIFNLKGGQWDRFAGLQLAERARDGDELLIKPPLYPDLFGHDMNYASRCIGAAKASGVYLTHKALERVRNSLSEKRPTNDLDDVVIVSVKGINKQPVAFYRVLKKKNFRVNTATIDAYNTKAIISLSTDKPQKVCNHITNLIRGKNTEDRYEKLRPHIFTVFWITRRRGQTSGEVLFRVEGPDQESIESIVTGDDGINSFLYNVFSERGKRRRAPTSPDTETKFIRTTAVHAHSYKKPAKWAQREIDAGSKPFFYVEVACNIFQDIDPVALKILKAKSLDAFRLIELGRLWGNPSIYLIIESAKPAGFKKEKTPKDAKTAVESILKAKFKEIAVSAYPCKDFASLVLEPGTMAIGTRVQKALSSQ